MTLTYRPQWSGSRIGSGFTVFNLEGTESTTSETAENAATAIRAWFNSLIATIPNDVSITFPGEMLVTNAATGELESVLPVTPPTGIVGDYSGAYAANAGRLVRWQTGAVLGGRRITGRTFLVPSGGVFTDGGNVGNSVIDSDAIAHAALLTALGASCPLLVVAKGTVTPVVPIPVVSGATLPRPTNLRSRND